MCFILASLYTWHSTTGSEIDVCVMAREDEVENEQEVAQPTEADATEATVDEEYVEEVVEEEAVKHGMVIDVVRIGKAHQLLHMC